MTAARDSATREAPLTSLGRDAASRRALSTVATRDGPSGSVPARIVNGFSRITLSGLPARAFERGR
jgi:hypothetical protein